MPHVYKEPRRARSVVRDCHVDRSAKWRRAASLTNAQRRRKTATIRTKTPIGTAPLEEPRAAQARTRMLYLLLRLKSNQRNETKLLLMELTIVRIVGPSPCCLEISNAHATTKPPATHVNAVTMVRWLGASVLASVSSHSSMVTSMSLTKVLPTKITEMRKTNPAKAHTHLPHAINVRAAAGILEGVHGRM
jgi:hypothetical protein